MEAGNEAFWLQVSRWGFEERGVLRAGVLRHRLESTGEQQSIYRVNDHVVVELDIQQRDGASWGAFKCVLCKHIERNRKGCEYVHVYGR